MEFTKDIYFDNSLKAGNEAKITYCGSLFQNGSNNVNIVYGFGEAWNNTTTKNMEKTENGFVANVRMRDFDTFNFCFSNENDNWDNNNCFNYISPILPNVQEILKEEPQLNLNTDCDTSIEIEQSEEIKNISFIEETNSLDNIEDNKVDFEKDYFEYIDVLIDDILKNATMQDFIDISDNNTTEKILEPITTTESLPEVEALFSELFSDSVNQKENTISPISEVSIEPELSEELKKLGDDIENHTFSTNKQVNLENKNKLINLFEELFETGDSTEQIAIEDNNELFETLNTTEQVANENNAKLSELFDELFEAPDTFNSFENIEEKTQQSDIINVNDELENVISPIKENVVNSVATDTTKENIQNTESPKLNIAAFNLDGLVSELLEPVIASETYADKIDETSLFDDLNSHEYDIQETAITVIDSKEFMVSPRKLSYFYKVRKRIRLAFFKLAKIPKDLVKQLGF